MNCNWRCYHCHQRIGNLEQTVRHTVFIHQPQHKLSLLGPVKQRDNLKFKAVHFGLQKNSPVDSYDSPTKVIIDENNKTIDVTEGSDLRLYRSRELPNLPKKKTRFLYSHYSSRMSFEALRERCLKEGVLFEDHEFPASHKSVYFSKVDSKIQWKRPREICNNPNFIVEKACRFDLDQGAIGNCWYIAGAAVLATKPEIFKKVVPDGQDFGDNYAGIFHFYFWRYGQWQEVIIDDRLPTYFGRFLCFCKNKEEPNEMWSALLEKAYAKVHGSYEALEGGWTEDALVDFTGGVGHRIDLSNPSKLPQNFWHRLRHVYSMNSLMGASINATAETMEHELSNGLVIGHAYSLTKISEVLVDGRTQRLVRLRNPWGKKEWKGAWSDSSREWQNIDPKKRQELGLINEEDGEFWMSYEDFIKEFEQLQLCHLPPDNMINRKRAWQEGGHHGSWVKGVSAGGCGNPPYRSLYWSNPQYTIDVTEPDEGSQHATVIVSLMQKHSRLKRTYYKTQMANIPMSFDLYKVKRNVGEPLDGETYEKNALQLHRRGGTYEYYRELTEQYDLDPGTYVVIPSTFDANVQADFLIRFYGEGKQDTSEIDIPTAPIYQPKPRKDVLKDLFERHSGSDGVVDARELRLILNEAFVADLDDDHEFELESCRSLLSMMDLDQSGVLEFNELRKMWAELQTWRSAFNSFDKDKSGYCEIKELRSIFKSIGYSLSKPVLKSIVRRYGGKEGRLAFNDFVLVATKVVVMMDVFTKHSKDGLKGRAKMTLDQFLEVVLYY